MTDVSLVQPDVKLALDAGGVIQEATLSNSIALEGVEAWVGRPWLETVGEAGGDRVCRMIREASSTGISAFAQITQRFPSGLELPIEYTIAQLKGQQGLVAIGRNLQAVAELQSRLLATQHARELEYWKLRDVEMRYRLLFDAANEAVLVIHASSLRVVESNIAAVRAFGLGPDGDLMVELDKDSRAALRVALGRTREHGRSPGIMVHMEGNRAAWMVRASLLTAEPGSAFLLQLSQVDAALARERDDDASLDSLMERLPDAFVVLDQAGNVRRANAAFLDLVQIAAEAMAIGEPLSRWLSRPGADMASLLAAVHRNRSVRMFTTTIEGELGSEFDVEIAAAGDSDQKPRSYAVMLRNVSRRAEPRTDVTKLSAALTPLTEGIGRVPLQAIVRNAVGIVERHYIQSALEMAGQNRTVAAELLSVSRQSLHTKLNRYNIASRGQSGDGGSTD